MQRSMSLDVTCKPQEFWHRLKLLQWRLMPWTGQKQVERWRRRLRQKQKQMQRQIENSCTYDVIGHVCCRSGHLARIWTATVAEVQSSHNNLSVWRSDVPQPSPQSTFLTMSFLSDTHSVQRILSHGHIKQAQSVVLQLAQMVRGKRAMMTACFWTVFAETLVALVCLRSSEIS